MRAGGGHHGTGYAQVRWMEADAKAGGGGEGVGAGRVFVARIAVGVGSVLAVVPSLLSTAYMTEVPHKLCNSCGISFANIVPVLKIKNRC